MNVDELYSIIALPEPKTQYTMRKMEKKPKKIKNFFDRINIFSGECIRGDSTVPSCTVQ